jgi:hypothetical protein
MRVWTVVRLHSGLLDKVTVFDSEYKALKAVNVASGRTFETPTHANEYYDKSQAKTIYEIWSSEIK